MLFSDLFSLLAGFIGFALIIPYVRYPLVRLCGTILKTTEYDSKHIGEIASVITGPFSAPYAHNWNNKAVSAMVNANKVLFTLSPILIMSSIFIGIVNCGIVW